MYMKAMFQSGNHLPPNDNHLHFTGVAANIMLTTSTAEVGNMSAALARHDDFDAGSWGAARQEKMLMALRAKFDTYPECAELLRATAGKSLAQASQVDRDHGIGLGEVDANLGMQWRGENFFGNCLELLRLELLAATIQKIAKRKRGRGRGGKGKEAKKWQQGRTPKGKGAHAAKANSKPKPKPKADAEEKVFIAGHMSDGEEGEEEGEEPKKKVKKKGPPNAKPKPKPNQGQEGGTAPAGTKCNVCQKVALCDRGIVMCAGCREWVHAEFKVCDKPAHQRRKMCSKGSIIFECADCVKGKVLAEQAQRETGPGGEAPDAMQANHTLLVAQLESFMSAQQVTETDLATKIDCPEAGIKAWLKSKQSLAIEKQYDQALCGVQYEQPPWWAPVARAAAAPVEADIFACTTVETDKKLEQLSDSNGSEIQPNQRELRSAVRGLKTISGYEWAKPAIKKALEGDVVLLQAKGEEVEEGFTMLMADVTAGHSVMLHMNGHWLLIAQIGGEITCFDPMQNGFCVFSCALQLWKRKVLGVGSTECFPSWQRSLLKLRNITSKSFTQIMEIESMSQCIFTSEVNEGQSQRRDKAEERMQWADPKGFRNEEEERNHLKAVAVQITKEGYDLVRACDGAWFGSWAKGFGVSVKPYGLCQHKEWTLQPLPPLPPVQPLEWDAAATGATVEAARPVGAGRASAVSQDAIAAANIVRVQELTLGDIVRHTVGGGGEAKGITAEGARTGGGAELQAAPPHPRNERPPRLIWFTTGHNTGDCFLAAAVTHTTHTSAGPRIPPTNDSIRTLRNEAGLQGGGSTSDTKMVELLRHLSYGCVLVQPSHKTATILNVTTNCTQCITVAMHGTGHVEPVVLGGTVQVRRLTEIVAMLSTYGVEVPLANVQDGANFASGAMVLSDGDDFQAGVQAGSSGPCSVQPEFGPGRALRVLPTVLPEREPYIFLSMMQRAKCEEVRQPIVEIVPPDYTLHIVPPNYTLYTRITHCTPRLHTVHPNYTPYPRITHCTIRLQIVPINYRLYP